MIIDVYASQANYWRHLAPVAAELERRGHSLRSWASRHNRPWGPMPRRFDGDTLLVASHDNAITDLARAHSRVVYLEHGAGQSYVGVHRGYAGAGQLEHVKLFLCPGEQVADRWRTRYPQAVVRAVGCPALDLHAETYPKHISRRARDSELEATTSAVSGTTDERAAVTHGLGADREPPLVALTAHWRCGIAPETMPALGRYMIAIAALRGSFTLLGHAHPRGARRDEARWLRLEIPFEPDPDVVLAALRSARSRGTAAVLVADNTSLMYEAAALGVPVLAVNAPTYRRNIEHGLRFWSHVPGLQVADPTDFHGMLDRALDDPADAQALRARAARYAYGSLDGRAASRAADAIEELDHATAD